MPSSRRTPRRRKVLRADMESAPTTNGRRVSEANRAIGPALRPEIVPRGLWRRKVPREGHGPPLQTMANARPNGKGTRPPAAVGRDALIPPHPAAAGTPAGGINPSPTNHGRPAANRGKRGPAVISDLCRGRCLHCARRRVSEANRAIGPALRPEIVPGTPRRRKVPREGHGPPLQTMANARPNGAAPGRCFHSGRGRAFLWCCCNRECQNGYSAPCSASRPCSPVRILTAFSTS